MRPCVPAAVVAVLLCAGCYSTREVILTRGEKLAADSDIRELTTTDGERITFTDSFGGFGAIEDTVVRGVSVLRGTVRIPVDRIRTASVREFDTFATVLGGAVAAAGAWLVVNRILASSGDDGGTRLNGYSPSVSGGGGGTGGGGG